MSDIITQVTQWLKHQVSISNTNGLVVGVSGGIDSAVCAALCKKTDLSCRYLFLDCESSSDDARYAQVLAQCVDIDLEQYDLTPVYDTLVDIVGHGEIIAMANIKPRLRMTTLYYIANLHNMLVAGTSNKSELMTGYFTKWGDGAADIEPLGSFTKREILNLARELGLPAELIQRPPTAGLIPGQTDEQDMNVSYEHIDAYLKSESVPELARQRIKQMISGSEHKRSMPAVFVAR